ncbi:helix-turn-helix domain-containing protein [Bacteroidota bacterium]
MVSEDLKKFAEELKSFRESNNITIEDIHRKTRIDIKILKALENADFNIMPEVYIRAFIKEYAKSIGKDEMEVIQDYELAKSGKASEQPETEEIEQSEKGETKKPQVYFASDEQSSLDKVSSNKTKTKSVLFAVGGIFLIVAIAVYFLFIKDSQKEIIKETPFERILADNHEKTDSVNRFDLVETKNDEISNPTQSELQWKLQLLIEALDTVWVRALSDNSTSEFILSPNLSKKLYADKNFTLLIGNAGGVKLTLNGNPLELRGKIGEIKNIRIDSVGLHYLRIE